jgi:hypothetical protein
MMRKKLSAAGLYDLTRESFSSIADHRVERNISYPLEETLSAGLALFSFKFPSLAKFIEKTGDVYCGHNIKTLFKISKVPSETQLRDILDPVNPESLRPAYDGILSALQRGNELQKFTVLGHYPVGLDGTGIFSSSKVSCPHCLTKKPKDPKKNKKGKGKGKKNEEAPKSTEDQENEENDKCIYHHQMLGASIVHPYYKQVIPLFPEAIINADGSTKNDCEKNASKRWIINFRKHHPKMPLLILEDSLASNVPHLETLTEYGCRYLAGVKIGDHKYLFEQFEINSKNGCTKKFQEILITGKKIKKTITKTYELVSGLELNKSNEFKTNFILFTEEIKYIDGKGIEKNEKTTFSWVTDLELEEKNLPLIVATARRRWGIENENFQTLKKTTDYSLEHNYGHGEKYLATIFALLCILAFLIDQAQEISCEIFKEILSKVGSKRGLWEDLRSAIFWNFFTDWGHFMELMRDKFAANTA